MNKETNQNQEEAPQKIENLIEDILGEFIEWLEVVGVNPDSFTEKQYDELILNFLFDTYRQEIYQQIKKQKQEEMQKQMQGQGKNEVDPQTGTPIIRGNKNNSNNNTDNTKDTKKEKSDNGSVVKGDFSKN